MGILLMIAQPFLVSVDILILFLSSSNPSGVNLLLSIGTGSELRKAVIPAEEEEEEEEFVYGEEHDLSRFPDGEKAPSPRSIASERLQQLGILG